LTVDIQENVILHGNHIIIPSALHERAIAVAHEGHQGLLKTKQLLCEKMWFPKSDDHKIDTCVACQANIGNSHPDPLQMSPLPPEP